jgi:inorganic pyrophosphatase
VNNSPDRVSPNQIQVPQHQELPPAPIDSIYDKWFFISGAAV